MYLKLSWDRGLAAETFATKHDVHFFLKKRMIEENDICFALKFISCLCM